MKLPNLSPSEMDDLDALRKAIQEFTLEHRSRRFGILREVGVQAALKRLADLHLGSHASVDATIVNQDGESVLGAAGNVRVENTDRVRLESKILLSSRSGASVAIEEAPGRRSDDRTDLLLYRRDGVKLVRYRNGPGDIVYRSFPESVLAAVEIKADPSHVDFYAILTRQFHPIVTHPSSSPEGSRCG